MREYRAETLRNIAVVGHGASGKTTLVDALAFVSGSSKRRGSVGAGTALTDTTAESVARGFSTQVGLAVAEWQGTKVNLLDTPGYLDFRGDALAGLAAADGALCVVSATAGVEVGTELMFKEALERKDPVLFVISMIDKEQASFERAYADIKAKLTDKVIPVEIPLGEGAKAEGVINLFAKKAYIYSPAGASTEAIEKDVPAEAKASFERYRKDLIEAISATDDKLLERYLSGVELGRDEAITGMKEAMKRGDLYPVFCVSAERMIGVQALLTELVQLMPSAYDMEELHAFKGAEGDHTVQLHAKDEQPFVAQVFKTVSEPHIGDVTYFRIFSGTAKTGQEVWNATQSAAEKLVHLSIAQGKERLEVPMLHAGDIGCVAKLKVTHTNDTLSTREHPVRMPAIGFPEPQVTFAVMAKNRADEEKLQQGLHRLHDEDPTFEVHYDAETHETIAAGLGERHLEVAMARLARKTGVEAVLTRPKVAYRETITANGEGQGRHKKQTGGRGQYGDCWIRLRPRARGQGYHFVDAVVGGAIPGKYIPAVDRGIREAAERGSLAGYPLVDFEAEVFDGSAHSVDSNEHSFKMAGILALRTVVGACKPVLLEPVEELAVMTPEKYVGEVMGDLSSRRGHILGSESAADGVTVVRAQVPRSALHLYATTLASLTHGHGRFTQRFHAYAEVPAAEARAIEAAARA